MDKKLCLLLAIQQIDNITELIKENEYQKFMYLHLTMIRVELHRQFTNLIHNELRV